MIKDGLQRFKGKRVLMLQGPVGPFFRRLSGDLVKAGAEVYKVNFNSGDCLFYPSNYIPFKGSIKEWPEFIEKLLVEKNIESVLLFGDCRRMHRIANKIATRLEIEVGVFEEGYVRPDYITLDRSGVNGHSLLPRNPEFYLDKPLNSIAPAKAVGHTVAWALMWAILYYSACILFPFFYSKYEHHRPVNPMELWPLFMSACRKIQVKLTERGVQEEIVKNHSGSYYLVPMQVHNDTQICVHSSYFSNFDFLEEIVSSFAANAPKDTILVLKQHPMDRGYHNYRPHIIDLAKKYQIGNRWRYIHDQHLPTLLEHARGVVLINSTVGLSALHHNKPMKVCGKSFYDMEGLTFQGRLSEFWEKAKEITPNRELYEKFRNYLVTHTQINGSIYKRLEDTISVAGLEWNAQDASVTSITEAADAIFDVKQAS